MSDDRIKRMVGAFRLAMQKLDREREARAKVNRHANPGPDFNVAKAQEASRQMDIEGAEFDRCAHLFCEDLAAIVRDDVLTVLMQRRSA